MNDNTNINGIDITEVPEDGTALAAANEDGASNAQNGNGFGDRINFERNLVNICANVNSNDQTKVEPPEPGTLTVNKQVFGCNNLSDSAIMDCQQFQDGSLSWLPCIGSSISNTAFCRSLPASIFDIEVLDDQNIQIQQFVGSAQGTTIPNLQPGTYTVNEIKDQNSDMNHLKVDATAEKACNSVSFLDGGILANTTAVEPITSNLYRIRR